MKKILIYIVGLFLLAGCEKEKVDLTFGEKPEERMSERLNELRGMLTSAENGWKAHLTTGAKGGYGFYFDFEDAKNVKMLSDLTAATSTSANTSTYRVIWAMNASLVFDTFNYLTMLQEPSGNYGGTAPNGYQSDIEFEYVKNSGDSIYMRGKRYKQPLILTKATAAEKVAYNDGSYKTSIDKTTAVYQSYSNPYIEVDLAGVKTRIALTLSNTSKTIDFGSVDASNKAIINTSKFAFNLTGFDILSGGLHRDVLFTRGEVEGNNLSVYDSNGTKYPVMSTNMPILPIDVMFNYSGAFNGMAINGLTLPPGINSSFNATWTALTNFHASNNMRTVSLTFKLTSARVATLDVRFTNGSTVYSAAADYNYTLVDGTLTLTSPISTNGNWNNGWVSLAVRNYFDKGVFKLTYLTSSDPNAGTIGGLIKSNDETAIFYGKLGRY